MNTTQPRHISRTHTAISQEPHAQQAMYVPMDSTAENKSPSEISGAKQGDMSHTLPVHAYRSRTSADWGPERHDMQTTQKANLENSLYMQLLKLITDCVVDRLCPRRTQEILLLLSQLESKFQLENQPASDVLEQLSQTWLHLHRHFLNA